MIESEFTCTTSFKPLIGGFGELREVWSAVSKLPWSF
jgi:hypothetical protein